MNRVYTKKNKWNPHMHEQCALPYKQTNKQTKRITHVSITRTSAQTKQMKINLYEQRPHKKKQIQPRHRNYKNSARDLAKKNKGITHELILLSRASEQKKQIGSYTYTFMHSTCERVKKKEHTCVNKAPERVKKIIKKKEHIHIHPHRARA